MTFTLRPYQADAVAGGLAAVEKARNGIIVMPTGSGKSLVIAGMAQGLGGRLVVLQPTKEILEQNYSKLYAFGHRDLSMWSASVGVKRKSQVTFATIGSIIKNVDLFSDADAVVVDECHLVNAKAGQYRDFLDSLGKPVVGLTATPYRMATTFGGSVVEAKFLHRTRPRLFDHVSTVVQSADLHEQGFLAPVEYIERDDYDPYAIALNSTGLNYDERALAAYNATHELTRKTADTIVGNYESARHFLVFVSSVQESKEVAAMLQAAGIPSAHIDGKTPKAERERILSDYQAGLYKVVTNVGVLTTGFDFPALDAVILARPTMSLPLYYQMVGRAVRTSPGKSCARVFDLCGNVTRFGRPDEYRIEAESGEKYRLKSGKTYLTGVNFVTGRDLEKQRERRAKAKTAKPGTIPFGKHAGQPVEAVPEGYLEWCVENFEPGEWRTKFQNELDRRNQERKVA